MDINKAYQLLEDFPFLQNARLAKVIQSSNGYLTEQDKLELYLYRGNPFLLSYQLKNKIQGTLSKTPETENLAFPTPPIIEEKSEPIELSISETEENTPIVNENDTVNLADKEETIPDNSPLIAVDTTQKEVAIDTDNSILIEEQENIIAEIVQDTNHTASAEEPESKTDEVEIDMNATSSLQGKENITIELPEEPAQASNDFYEPVYATDIFLHDGIKVENEIDNQFVEQEQQKKDLEIHTDPTSLMVTRTFLEWLHYYKEKKKKDEKETREKESLRAMWQKEKLTAAIEEENEIVPELVFKMAINSINDDTIVPSESLAEIYFNQQKYDKAIEMYRKLSLLNPEKSAYFAAKIKNISK